MIRMLVDNMIRIQALQLPNDLYSQINKDMVLDNPEYQQALTRGYSTYGKDKYIYLAREKDGQLILPRGYGTRLKKMLNEKGIEYKIANQCLKLPEVNFNSRIHLRGYQKDAVEDLVKGKQGGLVAGCGSGKTIVLLEVMARIKQPTLWICHTTELLNQTKERALEMFDIDPEDIGIISEGKINIGKKLTIGLVQTLSRVDLNEISNKFGAVFIDEAHHLAANTFFSTFNQFPAFYRYWASATPNREDGLTDMIYYSGGEELHNVPQDAIPTVIPRLVVVETDFFSVDNQYPRMLSTLIMDEDRNQIIVDTIKVAAPNNYSLVLSDRIEHLEILGERLSEVLPDLNIEVWTGRIRGKEKKELMKRASNKEIDIILATKIAREGLDIPHLNRLFLVAPKKGQTAITQEVGRIMRPADGKKDAVVYDFWDNESPIIRGQFWKRHKAYESLGIEWNTSVDTVKTFKTSFRRRRAN